MSRDGRRWRLPDVPPHVARRRRVLFATVLVLAGTALAWPLIDAWQDRVSQAAVRITAPAPPEPPPSGCTLQVANQQLLLPLAVAMRLTDLAGQDQNASASLAATSRQVAASLARTCGRGGRDRPLLARIRTGRARVHVVAARGASQAMQPDGLTARANEMWTAIKQIFGPLPAGGFMPGGVHTGHLPGRLTTRAAPSTFVPAHHREEHQTWLGLGAVAGRTCSVAADRDSDLRRAPLDARSLGPARLAAVRLPRRHDDQPDTAARRPCPCGRAARVRSGLTRRRRTGGRCGGWPGDRGLSARRGSVVR